MHLGDSARAGATATIKAIAEMIARVILLPLFETAQLNLPQRDFNI
jgi:hypothetical protein